MCHVWGGIFCWSHRRGWGQCIASSHDSHGSHTGHTAQAVHALHATAGAQLLHAGVGTGHAGQEHVWLFGGHTVHTGGTLGNTHAGHVAHVAHVAQVAQLAQVAQIGNLEHGCGHWGHCGHGANGAHGAQADPQYVRAENKFITIVKLNIHFLSLFSCKFVLICVYICAKIRRLVPQTNTNDIG